MNKYIFLFIQMYFFISKFHKSATWSLVSRGGEASQLWRPWAEQLEAALPPGAQGLGVVPVDGNKNLWETWVQAMISHDFP